MVWHDKSYYRLLIGNHTLAFDWCHFWWPWRSFQSRFSLPRPISEIIQVTSTVTETIYLQGRPKSKLPIHTTWSNSGPFSKFFHYHIHQKISNKLNKAIIKYPTSSQTRWCSTLWNTYVRKLAYRVLRDAAILLKDELSRILMRGRQQLQF